MHAGLGNFREIDVEDLTKHKMDSEQMFVDAKACNIVNQAKDENRRVCAVGTTVMRAIETAVGTDGHLKEFEGWTNKFIFLHTIFRWPTAWSLTFTCRFPHY